MQHVLVADGDWADFAIEIRHLVGQVVGRHLWTGTALIIERIEDLVLATSA
jgi:hypothetical protein